MFKGLSSYRHSLFLTIVGLVTSSSITAAVYRPGPDTNPGALPGSGSVANLQAAITNANASGDDDIIDLGGFVYTISTGNTTYANPDGATSGLPVIGSFPVSGKLSLINGVIKRSTEEGTPAFRFIYTDGSILFLYNMTLINGLNDFINEVPVIPIPPQGGAIYNGAESTLIMENTTFEANASFNDEEGIVGQGGAIYNSGLIDSIQTSTFSNNFSVDGGAIFNNGGIFQINNSTFAGNDGTGSGGGILNAADIFVISNSTFSGNSADSSGGGIYNAGGIEIISNSTIYGNSAVDSGGGIYNAQLLGIFNNNTVSENLVDDEGGDGEGIFNAGQIDSLFSNIFASNITADAEDIEGGGTWPPAGASGYNLIDTYTGTFAPNDSDITGVNANLGPLQDNGGPTFTAAIQHPSEAINAGFNPDFLQYDQRGKPYVRVACGVTDIGAYELQSCVSEQ